MKSNPEIQAVRKWQPKRLGNGVMSNRLCIEHFLKKLRLRRQYTCFYLLHSFGFQDETIALRLRSHHFDMHGNATDPNDWDSGNTILIYENAFYYDASRCNAIHIRGVPQNYAKVYHNAFVNVWECDINYAVRQIPEIPGNQMNFWNMYVYENIVCGYVPPYNQGQWTPGL